MRIRERFTWKGINTEVIQLVIMNSYKRMFLHDIRFLQVKSCEVCQRNSAKLAVGSTELHPIPVVTTWHHVSIDFIGPILPISTSGNRSVHRLSNDHLCVHAWVYNQLNVHVCILIVCA